MYSNPILPSVLGISLFAGGLSARPGASALGLRLFRPGSAASSVAGRVVALAATGAPAQILQLVVAAFTLLFAGLAVTKLVPKRI